MLQDVQVHIGDGRLNDVLDAGDHGLAQVAVAAVLGGEEHLGVVGVPLQIGIQRLAQLRQSGAVEDDVHIAAEDRGLDGGDPVIPGAGLHQDLYVGVFLVPFRDQLVVAGHFHSGNQVHGAIGANINEVRGSVQAQGDFFVGVQARGVRCRGFRRGSIRRGSVSRRGLCGGSLLFGAAGSQGKDHDQCQQHCDQLFHCVSS